jgi:hypothetical protein
MNKLILLATTALVAFSAMPAFADVASIIQSSETNGTATQHQPGQFGGSNTDNAATIMQAGGNGDVATQEQDRGGPLPPGFLDFSANSTMVITQTNNAGATATQEDNSNGPDMQTITQTGTTNGTSAGQFVDSPGGSNNTQTSTQTQDSGSSVFQVMGSVVSETNPDTHDVQSATQNGQTNSRITQEDDGTTSGNVETATQVASGANNTMASDVTNGNNNTIVQTQDAGANGDQQLSVLTSANGNYTEQYQGVGSASSDQTIFVTSSSDGRALQYQGIGVVSGNQFISQFGGGVGNQAGQGQGNSGNSATAEQSGGSGNIAIQNQGLSSSDPGFMFVNGAGVVVHN